MAPAASFYVDLNNGGPGAGTMADPFQTVGQAVSAVNAMQGTHDIFLADGVYRSTLAGGLENFGAGGHVFSNPSGGGTFQNINLSGGYTGLTGGGFDWTNRVSRTSEFDLSSAGTRAFDTSGEARVVLAFDGFTFRNANTTGDGGAIHLRGGFAAEVSVNDSLFENNTATGKGGALTTGWRSVIENSEFRGNTADIGGAIRATGSGGGTNNPTVRNNVFDDNTATGAQGGGAITFTSQILIEGAVFTDNQAIHPSGVGGAISGEGNAGTATIVQSVLSGNSAFTGGAAGGSGFDAGDFVFENSLLTGNQATNFTVSANGNQPSSVEFRFTTLADNTGGGISTSSSANGVDASVVVLDSIVANNGDIGITTDDATANIDFNDVFGHNTNFAGMASQGPNGLSVDPQFVDAAGGDYRLLTTSPLLDAGSDLGIDVDLLGDMRPQGGGFAMGAYEAGVNPVPEPASLALGLLGVVCGVVFARRCLRRKASGRPTLQ